MSTEIKNFSSVNVVGFSSKTKFHAITNQGPEDLHFSFNGFNYILKPGESCNVPEGVFGQTTQGTANIRIRE